MTKKLRRFFKFCSFVVLSVSFSGYVVAYTSPGHPTGFVDDFAQVFTVEQKTNLESKLRVFNASTTNEIAVVTIKSLEGDYIEHYASELFKEWQIGKAKQDNGVLLLVAMDDHKMRIEVGYGLEGALTDARSSQIIRDDLTPAFKQNDFYGGIEKAIDDIMKATKGEYAQTTTQPPSKIHFSFDIWVIILIIAAQFISFIASLFARSKSWWAGGVVGGILGIVNVTWSFWNYSYYWRYHYTRSCLTWSTL